MAKKGDLSTFEHGMGVGAKWAGLSILEIVGARGQRSDCFKLIRRQQ